ncbi:hypothetical protein D0Y65_021199 [Glycine soja]|uniref:Uncharacterized protein n=1 Tax=Glycine soja TaxID=3848 RepID=A0A445JHX7_GLYSO|nr:hypothetical protein D0Y65_021199 [Glycine soja]
MLLRSSSAPILTSLLHYSKESSSEPEHILNLPKTASALSLSQNLVEIDLKKSSSPKRKNRVPLSSVPKNQQSKKIKERDEGKDPQQKTCMKAKSSIQELFSSLDLDKGLLDHEERGSGKKDSWLQTSVMGGGMGSDGGWICGGCNGSGRGSGGGHGKRWGFHEGNDHGRDRTEAYYQNMIEANPSDALLLGNYAKFLKEVIICSLVMFYFSKYCEKQKMILRSVLFIKKQVLVYFILKLVSYKKNLEVVLNYLPNWSDHPLLKNYQAG